MFLACRFLLPFLFMAVVGFWIFGLGNMEGRPFGIRLLVMIVSGYIGFYAPNITSATVSRNGRLYQAGLAGCAGSDAHLRGGWHFAGGWHARASEEIGQQSAELAEELVLTTAELSFLPDRKVALENLPSAPSSTSSRR